MSGKAARPLIWVPIVHTQADLGSIRQPIEALYTRRVGREQWHRHVETVGKLWRAIRQAIELLDLDYRRVRLYQDGLPDCGKELAIVRDLARAGSQNHQLLLDLVEKGAHLTGTESPRLLMEEYAVLRQMLESLDGERAGVLAQRHRERSAAILKERDRYIARRISGTLRPQETGLIFLGMLHSLEGLLPASIRLTVLGGRALSCPGRGRPRQTDREVGTDAEG